MILKGQAGVNQGMEDAFTRPWKRRGELGVVKQGNLWSEEELSEKPKALKLLSYDATEKGNREILLSSLIRGELSTR